MWKLDLDNGDVKKNNNFKNLLSNEAMCNPNIKFYMKLVYLVIFLYKHEK